MANLFDELKRELGLPPKITIYEAAEVLRVDDEAGEHEAWLEYIAANSRGKAKEWAEAALAGESPPEE